MAGAPGGGRDGIMSKRALTHVTSEGQAHMVNVAAKAITARTARAEVWVAVGEDIAELLRQSGGVAKGNVLETARLAGIMAAKRTSELIPMCHPLILDAVEVDAALVDDRVRLEARVTCEGKTGVEMEALTAAAVAALTVYDMVKSASKEVEIGPLRLIEKTGGKSGRWRRGSQSNGQG